MKTMIMAALMILAASAFGQNAASPIYQPWNSNQLPVAGNMVNGVWVPSVSITNEGALVGELKPSLTIATSSGTVAAGARMVSIALSDDFSGTILGTSVSPLDVQSLTFTAPANSTLGAIPYTRSSGSLTIIKLTAE